MKANYTQTIINSLHMIDSSGDYTKAGEVIAKAYINRNKVFTFGTGHSHMFGEELYARAGGWNYIKPMLLDELTLSSHPFKSTLIERVEGYADVLFGLFPLSKGDVIIITSNSGRNGLIVEMSKRAKSIGATVIAVTSISHSSFVKSRHSSGKSLADFADIVVDNTAPMGDGTVEIGNKKIGPISSITSIFIAHQIVIHALFVLKSKNIEFDIFCSSNLDGNDEENVRLMGCK